MTGPVEGLLWGALGLAAFALLVQPGLVFAIAALQRRKSSESSPRRPLVTLVTIGRLRDRHLCERIAMLVRAARFHGRCECLVGVPEEELGYVRERLGRMPGVRLLSAETTGFDVRLLRGIASQATCDAVLVVPPGVTLDEDAIVRMSAELREGIGLVQGLVECAENSPWLSTRMAGPETVLGGLHRIGDGPFVVRAERLVDACERANDDAGVDAGTLAMALAAAGERMAVAGSVAVATARTSLAFLECEDDAARHFGWGPDVRDRAGRAGGPVGRWLRFQERLRGWTPGMFVVAIAANMALAADPFHLKVLVGQEVAHVVWLLTRRRVTVSQEDAEPAAGPEPIRAESSHAERDDVRRNVIETVRADRRAGSPAPVRDPRRGTRSTTVLHAHR